MEPNWGEIMPELADRLWGHISTGSRLHSQRCDPAICWLAVNMQLGVRTPDRLTAQDHLAFLKCHRRSGHPLVPAGRFARLPLWGISLSQMQTHKATCCVEPQPRTAKGQVSHSGGHWQHFWSTVSAAVWGFKAVTPATFHSFISQLFGLMWNQVFDKGNYFPS